MITIGGTISYYNPANFAVSAFVFMGIFAFLRGVFLYESEVQSGKKSKVEGYASFNRTSNFPDGRTVTNS